MKKHTRTVFGLAFAAIVFLAATLLMLGGVKDHFRRKALAASGVTIEAIVNGINDGHVERNGDDYYSISYVFYDDDGNSHYGKTSASYKRYEAELIMENGIILVKYDPRTFESIEVDYNFNGDGRARVIVFFIIAACSAMLWVVFIVQAIKLIQDSLTLKFGKETIGTYVLDDEDGIKESPLHVVHFSWTDEKGKIRVDRSPAIYTKKEAELFKKAQTFRIKVLGNNGIIISNLGEVKKTAKYALDPDIIRCDYCGAELSSNAKKCKACGSARARK